MPCCLHLHAPVKAGSPAQADALPQRQSYTSIAGLEIVSLDNVGEGEDSSPQYHAQLQLPKANVDPIFVLKYNESFQSTHCAGMTESKEPSNVSHMMCL